MTQKPVSSDSNPVVDRGCGHRDDVLRDALDHIVRVARNARVPTRRLDWIVSRGQLALDGKPFDMDAMPRYPKMQHSVGWRPIIATAPHDTRVLVADLSGWVEICFMGTDSGFWQDDTGDCMELKPVAWMPLPEPPNHAQNATEAQMTTAPAPNAADI